jgi:hypothetical protein
MPLRPPDPERPPTPSQPPPLPPTTHTLTPKTRISSLTGQAVAVMLSISTKRAERAANMGARSGEWRDMSEDGREWLAEEVISWIDGGY